MDAVFSRMIEIDIKIRAVSPNSDAGAIRESVDELTVASMPWRFVG